MEKERAATLEATFRAGALEPRVQTSRAPMPLAPSVMLRSATTLASHRRGGATGAMAANASAHDRLLARLIASSVRRAQPAAFGVIQQVIDHVVESGSWLGARWLPFAAHFEPPLEWPRAFPSEAVAFWGDSTTRELADEFRGQLRWPRAYHLPCGHEGSGCANCFYCCHNLPPGRFNDNHDYVARLGPPYNTTLMFFWKPELADSHDAAAMARLCSAPPALLVLGLGAHEAAFATFDGDAARWEDAARAKVRALASRLSCLPESTAVVFHTAAMAANRGFHGLRDGARQAALMALTRRGTMDLFRSGELGRSYLLDTFALTRAANATGSESLVSADGHHYPTAVRQLEMAITYVAYRLHRLGLALRPRERTKT